MAMSIHEIDVYKNSKSIAEGDGGPLEIHGPNAGGAGPTQSHLARR